MRGVVHFDSIEKTSRRFSLLYCFHDWFKDAKVFVDDNVVAQQLMI